jgi:G3E family GTPase
MPLLEPIPLTVLAGGPEMPSLLPQLLGLRSDLALIAPDWLPIAAAATTATVSDIGAVDRHVAVVPDVGERSPGCPCCRLRLDLVDAVAVLVRRRSRPRHIVVAVPDLPADPAASSVTVVVHTVLSDPDLRRWVRLDGVVATLDAVPTVTRLRTGSPVVDPVGAERLAIADRVLVARADQVVGSSLVELRDLVGRLNRIAPVLAPAIERVSADQLVSIDAWHGAPRVRPEVRPHATTRTGGGPTAGVTGAPDLVVIEQQGVLDPGGVEEWLDLVLSQHAPRLVRLQGALAVDGSPSRVCCHGVGSYAMSHPEHEHPGGRRSDTSVVMLIGHGLPADELAAGLRATAVR